MCKNRANAYQSIKLVPKGLNYFSETEFARKQSLARVLEVQKSKKLYFPIVFRSKKKVGN